MTELKRAGKRCFMLGFHARVRAVLGKTHWFHDVNTFHDYESLLSHLREHPDAPPASAAPSVVIHADGGEPLPAPAAAAAAPARPNPAALSPAPALSAPAPAADASEDVWA